MRVAQSSDRRESRDPVSEQSDLTNSSAYENQCISLRKVNIYLYDMLNLARMGVGVGISSLFPEVVQRSCRIVVLDREYIVSADSPKNCKTVV